jgi:hypothetical protein
MPKPNAAAAYLALSPLGAAIASSPQFETWLSDQTIEGFAAKGQILALLANFLASPAGQALESALIRMVLSMLNASAA